MLEFENAKGVAQRLYADCVMGIAWMLEMSEPALRKYATAYVAAVLDTNVSVVSNGAGA